MEKCDVELLENIKVKITKMTSLQHLEILKILHDNEDVKINENKSGIFVNLSFLPKTIIDKINIYLNYVNDQEKSLDVIETRKETVKHKYFEEDCP
tara:strand:+ start:137 stop:424 length:288 start_codon:yes stop_codon:yes gene_type:complete